MAGWTPIGPSWKALNRPSLRGAPLRPTNLRHDLAHAKGRSRVNSGLSGSCSPDAGTNKQTPNSSIINSYDISLMTSIRCRQCRAVNAGRQSDQVGLDNSPAPPHRSPVRSGSARHIPTPGGCISLCSFFSSISGRD